MIPAKADVDKANSIVDNRTILYVEDHEDLKKDITKALTKVRREVLNNILKEVDKIYHLPCKQKEHDVRWCSYCENRRDGIDIVTEMIEKNRGGE